MLGILLSSSSCMLEVELLGLILSYVLLINIICYEGSARKHIFFYQRPGHLHVRHRLVLFQFRCFSFSTLEWDWSKGSSIEMTRFKWFFRLTSARFSGLPFVPSSVWIGFAVCIENEDILQRYILFKCPNLGVNLNLFRVRLRYIFCVDDGFSRWTLNPLDNLAP